MEQKPKKKYKYSDRTLVLISILGTIASILIWIAAKDLAGTVFVLLLVFGEAISIPMAILSAFELYERHGKLGRVNYRKECQDYIRKYNQAHPEAKINEE